MKTHKIKYGGEFGINGYDDTGRTYCGITENYSEALEGCFVKSYEPCTCKKCNKAHKKELARIGGSVPTRSEQGSKKCSANRDTIV